MFKYSLWGLLDLETVFVLFAVDCATFALLLFIAKKLHWTPRQMILWLWDRAKEVFRGRE